MMAMPDSTPTTLTNMLDRDDIGLHWNHGRAMYTCADLVEVAVERKSFLLDRKHLFDNTDYLDYLLYGNRGIFANG